MTSLDIVFIVFMVFFMLLGARLGSLWTGTCLVGGFFGAFLVEYYTLPLSSMMGHFPGTEYVAGGLLFMGGVAIAMIPGWLLSRLTAVFFVGVLDSLMGLLTGFLAGLVATTMAVLFILPHAPKVERSAAWKNSRLVRPFHSFIVDIFNESRLQKGTAVEQIRDDFMKNFSPAIKETEKTLKTTTNTLVDKIKKK